MAILAVQQSSRAGLNLALTATASTSGQAPTAFVPARARQHQDRREASADPHEQARHPRRRGTHALRHGDRKHRGPRPRGDGLIGADARSFATPGQSANRPPEADAHATDGGAPPCSLRGVKLSPVPIALTRTSSQPSAASRDPHDRRRSQSRYRRRPQGSSFDGSGVAGRHRLMEQASMNQHVGQDLCSRLREERERLGREFLGRAAPDVVERSVNTAQTRIADARVTDYVPIFFGRHARRLIRDATGVSAARPRTA
jgi:hypothetical protein